MKKKELHYRIRYEHHRKNIYRSVQMFKGSGAVKPVFRIFLDYDNLTYIIRNMTRYTIVRSSEKDGTFKPANVRALKRQAKKALFTLGSHTSFGHDYKGGWYEEYEKNLSRD